jgi:hypothetical protein
MNREESFACSKETQFGSESGLNRLNSFYNLHEARNHPQKRGENKMKKLRRLLLASGIGIAFVAICVISVPVSAGSGYYYVPYGEGDWNWQCKTEVKCYYITPSYEITYSYPPGRSTAEYHANGGLFVGCTINEWNVETNTDNIMAYVRATFYPWGASEWTSESQSWSYPSYTAEPYGGFYHEW